MEMKKMYYVVPVVILLLVIGGYYGFVMMNTGSEGGGVVGNGQVREFTVVGTSTSTSPSTIEVNKGDTVIINYYSSCFPYSFTIDGYGVSTYVTPCISTISGSSEFVASKPGTFTFEISVPGYGNTVGKFIVND